MVLCSTLLHEWVHWASAFCTLASGGPCQRRMAMPAAANATNRRHRRAGYVGQGVVQPVWLPQQFVAEKQTDPWGKPLATQSAFDAHSPSMALRQ